ncbi:putative short-chain dehydrogenase [Xylaria curta]|nr:putative short-chain dehydrogenase [Xylaria curta]
MASDKSTIIITGADGGLGKALVRHVLSSPELSQCHGLYTVRDKTSSSSSALLSILRTAPSSHTYDVISLDLTKPTSVREVSGSINNRVAAGEIAPIRALIMNAGVNEFSKQTWTDEGLDTAFAANYLGHWLLTLLILRSMNRDAGRIVALGSQSHDPHHHGNDSSGAYQDKKWKTIFSDANANAIDSVAKGSWSTSKDDPSWLSGFRRYGASKLCGVMMIGELQRRLNADAQLNNVCALTVNPGTMSTGLQRSAPWFIRVVLFSVIFPVITWFKPYGNIRTTTKSAADVLSAAFGTSPTLGQYPKGLYLDGLSIAEPSAESKDELKRKELWSASVKYIDLKAEETILANCM